MASTLSNSNPIAFRSTECCKRNWPLAVSQGICSGAPAGETSQPSRAADCSSVQQRACIYCTRKICSDGGRDRVDFAAGERADAKMQLVCSNCCSQAASSASLHSNRIKLDGMTCTCHKSRSIGKLETICSATTQGGCDCRAASLKAIALS